jgi:CRP/FNR family transcriptional regulator, cyclic AMP receptor protein
MEGVQNNARALLEELLAGIAELTYVPAGDLVFRAGAEPGVALIRMGIVRVFIRGTSGRQVTLRYARPGDLIGLGALLGGSCAWSAEAVVDSNLEVPTVEQMQALASRHPELPWLIAEEIAATSANAIATLAESWSQPMASRVARHLREMALPTPDGRAVAHISQQQLADAAGTAREVVSRELHALRAQGVIATKSQRVEILDEELLGRIAAGGVPARES